MSEALFLIQDTNKYENVPQYVMEAKIEQQ